MNTETARTVLLVDDEEILREILAQELRGLGYSVFEARGANEAFRLLQAQHIDLVISDIRMPDGDGFELLENMENFLTNPPPLIFITGFQDHGKGQNLDRRTVAVLTKPFDLDVFERLVVQTLETCCG